MTNPQSGIIADLIKQHREDRNNPVVHTQLINAFKAPIRGMAGKFPEFWKDDAIQEGNIGLWKAMEKFPALSRPEDFFPYALTTIQNQMNDFYSRQIGRHKSVMISELQVRNEESDEGKVIEHPATDGLLQTSLFEFGLSDDSIVLGQRERDALILQFEGDLTLEEASKVLGLSVSQTGKIIQKAKQKVQKLIA